jgi:predicted nucleic acid-binding protein
VPEIRADHGLLDTSVLIAPEESAYLPAETSISALSLAELTAGPHATDDPGERGRRQSLLQHIESTYDPLPFDASCARAYGPIYSVILETGRKARGRRVVDLLIAATAIAHELPLYTRNPADLHGLNTVLEIVDCTPSG